MAIPAIDNLSAVLYVPTVTSQSSTQPSALSQRQPFATSIAPSRSKDLTELAVAKSSLVSSVIEGLASLINIAEKTNLPTNFPETSRVTLQADISRFLNTLETIVDSAEVGSVSLLRSDNRTLYLETNELGGKIKVQGVAVDSQALGLSNINVLSDLGVEDAARRINDALYSVEERLGRIQQLNDAISQGFNYGSLVNSAGGGTSLGNSVAQDLSIGSDTYSPPIQYSNPVSGQYAASSFNRGSFVNLIG
ncbi:hypothetical protein RYZ26_05400 [Terasakiella sp. A23]|uniref:hypothetical protein n=1 Tax=Terasakiella sp. FCG-A23 TaxID=3080561 RepID=UPI002954AD63|nr:hypothetical protein [Terasakiella sp. A23]MDV7339016.1 hypothetical protein [Terasakiella sp. A23]